MKRLFSSVLVAAVAAASSLVTDAKAVPCYALTSDNHLFKFDSSNPLMVTDVTLVMPDPAYSVVGIDIRTTTQTVGAANPGVGSLWGIAYNSSPNFRLCVINPTSGVVTFVGGVLVMDDSANADAFGFGFDPSRDRFQFISVQHNYELDPNTITFQKQTNITFPTAFPAQSGAAFTTASYGGTSQFYNISRQASPRTLQTSANISSGSLTQVNPGGLGIDVGAPLGIAISGGLFLLANSDDGNLYSINRASGTKTDMGNIGGAAPGFRGLAIVPASFPPALPVTIKIKGSKKITTTNAAVRIMGTAASQSGIELVQYKIGKGKYKKAKGTTKWKFNAKLKTGVNKISVRATGGNDVISKIVKVKATRVVVTP
jgi:hypothetical protein